MSARNTGAGYGWVSRLVHWAMAVGILGMIGLGLRIATMQPRLSNLWLYGLHKSIGLVLLALVLLRLAWHRLSPPPPLPAKLPAWQHATARMAHGGLYALMLAVPLCGWVASAATGIDVTGSSVLYLVDTERRQLAVYQAQGGTKSTMNVRFVGARNIDLDLQVNGYNDKSEYSYSELAKEFAKKSGDDGQ